VVAKQEELHDKEHIVKLKSFAVIACSMQGKKKKKNQNKTQNIARDCECVYIKLKEKRMPSSRNSLSSCF